MDHSVSDSASYPEEKEISEGEDEDDDRNHKHRKRETRSQSLEGDSFDQMLTRPYRKKNKPFENGYSFRGDDPQSGQHQKNSIIALERDFSSRIEKRRSNQTSFSRPPFDLSHRIRENQLQSGEAGLARGSRGEPVAWSLNDSRNGLVDFASQMVQPRPVPSGLLAGRGLPESWNAFGIFPGIPNGGFDALHPLAMQGALRPSIIPSINMGIPRQQCRDFEERGFCLRGDMCPMEHGLNRIVVEDVQSLSQFNLSVSVPATSSAFPVMSTSSGSLVNTNAIHTKNSKCGMAEDGLRLNGSLLSGSMVGGSDVYDPDQPLWTNDNPETSAALLALNQLSADETESFQRKDRNLQSTGLDDEHPVGNGAAAGPQNVSVWRRISSSTKSSGVNDKLNSLGSSSSYREQDIKNEEERSTGLQDISYQGKRMNVDENVSKVKVVSDKPYIQNQSNKALRTLFVNGIPLNNNTRECLLSHFRKFGKVIDIYIPKHSERAFVQFSKREEAEAALKAPDAVMGNRFIKLWWANRDNIPDYGINGPGGVPTSHGLTLDPARSHPFIPVRGKENPNPAGAKNVIASVAQAPGYDHPKPPAVNGSNTLHVQQKKLGSLELLKEQLHKKQQMLDQKRTEFRRQLSKLEKQASSSKDVAESDHADKRLKGETPIHQTNAETSKSSSRANTVNESSKSTEHSMTHTSTSKPTGLLHEPSSSRPSIRPQAPIVTPFPANRFKLDNRPTAFRIVSPLPAGLANVATLKEHFSTYGDLSSVQLEAPELQDSKDASATPNVSACVSFTTRRSAEKAFLHGKCWQGHNLQFMWLTPCKERGVSVNPSAASNTPSDANSKSTKEAQKTTAAVMNGEPGNLESQSDAVPVSQE